MTEEAPRMVNLGSGRLAPYPEPTSEAATKMGRANRRSGTKPEIALRSELHRRGLRFRKDLLLRYDEFKVHPDIVFTRARAAVFVDGCFWHGCPQHQVIPKRNRDYWIPKLAANVERDRSVGRALEANGWTVLRFWEHESQTAAADVIEPIVRRI